MEVLLFYFCFKLAEIQFLLVESEDVGSQNCNDEVQEAILWYNRVLGFHIEGGHGN